MFLFQANAYMTSPTLVGAFKSDASDAISRLDKGESKQKVISGLYSKYLDALFKAGSKSEKNQLYSAYLGVVFHTPKPASGFVNPPTKANQKILEETMDHVASVIHSRLLLPTPQSFYGSSRASELPYWKNENLDRRYKNMNDAMGTKTEQERYDATLSFINASNKYGTMTTDQKEMLAILMSLGSLDALESALNTLTATQKAIDGISLAISKSRLNGYMGEEQFQAYFPKASLDVPNGFSQEDISQLRMFAGFSPKDASYKGDQAAIDLIFSRTNHGGTQMGERLVNLVIETNFGENAGALSALMEDMNGKGTFDANASALDNLKSFYATLLGANGLQSAKYQKAWNGLKGLSISMPAIAGQTASSSTLADWLANSNHFMGSTDTIGQGTSDISTIAAFMMGYSKSAYFKSALFKDPDHVKQFLEAVYPAYPLPAVQLSVLSDTETLDFLYKNFRNNPSGLISIVSQVSDDVERIYSMPFGTEFNSPDGNSKIATKHEAAQAFVAHIQKLEGNWLLEDLRARFTQNEYVRYEQYLRIRGLEEILSLRGPDYDYNYLGRDLRALTMDPSLWKDTNTMREAIRRYVTENPQFTLQDIEREYIALGKLPENFVQGISRTFDRMLRQDLQSRVTELGVSGSGHSLTLSDEQKGDRYDNTQLYIGGQAVTAPGGRIGANYNLNSQQDINDGIPNVDTMRQERILDAQNLYAGQSRIYSLYMDWVTDHVKSISGEGDLALSEITDQSLVSQLRTYMAGTDVVMFVDWNAHDASVQAASLLDASEVQPAISQMSAENRSTIQNIANSQSAIVNDDTGTFYASRDSQGNLSLSKYNPPSTQETNELHFDVVLYRDGSFFRVIGLDRHEKELTDLFSNELKAQQLVLEHSQWTQPIGTYGAVELWNRKREGENALGEVPPINPQTRFGMAIGVENGAAKLAGLFQETAMNGQVAAISHSTIKPSKQAGAPLEGTVYSAGYIKYEDAKDRTNLLGQPSGIYTSHPLGLPTPENPLYFMSHMSSKLYGIYMGNQEMAAMRVSGDNGVSNISAGGLFYWGKNDVKTVRFSGQYIYKDELKLRGFYDFKQDQYQLYGGRAIIPLSVGKDVYLHLYGINQVLYKNDIVRNRQFDDWLSEMKKLSEDINVQMAKNSGTNQWEQTEDGRAEIVRDWTIRLQNLLNQAQFLLPANVFNDIQNQFAIGIEWRDPKTSRRQLTKFSYAKVAPTGAEMGPYGYQGQGDIYLLNTTSTDLGTNSIVTFTAGVLAAPLEGSTNPKNVAGVKFDVGNLAFGMTGYNVVDSGKAMRFDVGYLNPNYKGALLGLERTGGSITAFEKGSSFEYGVGNNKLFMKATQTLSQGAVATSIAAQYSLYNAVSMSALAGLAVRGGSLHELGINEWEVYGTATGGRFSAHLAIGRLKGRVENEGAQDTFYRDWTFELSGQYRLK